MGDILFTLPALRVLRENFPDRKITFLTSKEFAPILAGFRDVDEILTLDRSLFRRGNPVHIARESWSLIASLRRRKFSLVVDFQGYGETALITWLTRAPQRWGTVYQSARGYAYTRGVRRTPQIHPAEGQSPFVGTMRPRRSDRVAISLCSRRRHGRSAPIIYPARTGRVEIVVVHSTLHQFGAKKLAAGKLPRAGQPLARRRRPSSLRRRPRGKSARLEPVFLAGFPTSAGAPLLVSAGLAKLCNVTIAGDTGLLHIAVAMNKRVVFLALRTRHPYRFYPFRHPEWKLTPPVDADISAVTLSKVIAACENAFADSACAVAN